VREAVSGAGEEGRGQRAEAAAAAPGQESRAS